MPLFNDTPFSVGDLPVTLDNGANVLAVVVKGTFVREGDGACVLAEEQRAVRMTDELYDTSGNGSSVLRPGDHCARKHGADVVVIGDALSDEPVRAMEIAVAVRDRSVALRVHGERLFERGATGVAVGEGQPFHRMPVCYERCYGGMSSDMTQVELRNPVGRGVAADFGELVGTPAPQIEEVATPFRSPASPVEPVCFGAIPCSWMPRAAFFGTCDDVWRKERMPLPPADYDGRFENVAHPRLLLDAPLCEGEVVGVRGMSLDVPNWTVTLPPFSCVVAARYADGRHVEVQATFDTLLLEPNVDVVEATMRASLPIGRGACVLREVAVRHG